MRVFCRLSWEEESNVSTGDENSPAGKCEFFFTYQVAVNLTFYLSSFGEKIRKNCKNLVPHDFRFGD